MKREIFDKLALSYMDGLVLDVACGEGRFISQAPERIYGVDWNEKSIDICINKGYTVSNASVTNMPFGDGMFDAVNCSHIIEHLMPQEAHKMLTEMDRVLKRGGVMAIQAPLMNKNFYNDFTHLKPYNSTALRRYLVGGKQKTLGDIGGYEELLLEYRKSKFRMRNTGYLMIFRKL